MIILWEIRHTIALVGREMNNPAASSGVSIGNSQTADTGLRQFYAASCGELNPKRLKNIPCFF